MEIAIQRFYICEVVSHAAIQVFVAFSYENAYNIGNMEAVKNDYTYTDEKLQIVAR